MPNFLPSLNEHFRRLARREIRAQTIKTKRAAATHRRDIAALKRQIKALTTRLAIVERHGERAPVIAASGDVDKLRFRADGFKTHRAKLGLSAKDYGKLIGVSSLTVYNWEAKKSKPRRKQLPAIAAVRMLGKREALAKLNGK